MDSEASSQPEIGPPKSWGGRILDIARQEGWRVLKIGQFSWMSYVYRPQCNFHL